MTDEQRKELLPEPVPQVEFDAPSEQEIRNQALEPLKNRGSEWENRAIVMKRFMDEGYTPEQAAGAIGNFVIEAGNDTSLPPNIKQGGGGPGRGIVQWENVRREQIEAQYGKDWDKISLEDQLDFIFWEFKNTEQSAAAALKNANSVYEATDVILNEYERPAARIIGPRLANAAATLSGFQEELKAQQQAVQAARPQETKETKKK